MPKTATQIEQELAELKAQIAEKEKDLEQQKMAELEALKAEREKGIRDAWAALTEEFVKAGHAARASAGTDRGQKIAEARFNKKCYEQLGKVLGFSEAPAAKKNTGRSKLNDDQKAKIRAWVKEGVKVAEMNRRTFTSPSTTTYQRINSYVRSLKQAGE